MPTNNNTATNRILIPSAYYRILDVTSASTGSDKKDIREMYTDNVLPFERGSGYYQLTKSELIQQNKEVLAMDISSGQVFKSPDWRIFLNLPVQGGQCWQPTGRQDVRIDPKVHPNYTFFVQSTSHNRKLVVGTKFLVRLQDWSSVTANSTAVSAP